MYKVIFGDNMERNSAITSADVTVAEFMARNGFDAGTRSLSLNGNTLRADDTNKSFAQLFREYGITGDKASLLALTRKDNA